MRILLVLALGASAAVAQAPADSLDAAPPGRPMSRVLLVIGGMVGSYALTTAATAAAEAVAGDPRGEAGEWLPLVTIPAGAALGVIGMGAMAEAPGSAVGAAQGAALGALIGYGLAWTASAAAGGRWFAPTPTEGAFLWVAVLAVGVLPSVGAARGYTAVPVRVRAPDGTSAPGVALRVAL